MSECQHTSVTEREDKKFWTDTDGNVHTVVYLKCANPFCDLFGKTVHVKQTGSDTPTRYSIPPVIFKGGKP